MEVNPLMDLVNALVNVQLDMKAHSVKLIQMIALVILVSIPGSVSTK